MARPPAPEPYTTYNLIIPERQKELLAREAHRRRISIAALIRELIERHIGGEARAHG